MTDMSDYWVIQHDDGAHGNTVCFVASTADLVERCEVARQQHIRCFGGDQQGNVRAYRLNPDGSINYSADTYRHTHVETF